MPSLKAMKFAVAWVAAAVMGFIASALVQWNAQQEYANALVVFQQQKDAYARYIAARPEEIKMGLRRACRSSLLSLKLQRPASPASSDNELIEQCLNACVANGRFTGSCPVDVRKVRCAADARTRKASGFRGEYFDYLVDEKDGCLEPFYPPSQPVSRGSLEAVPAGLTVFVSFGFFLTFTLVAWGAARRAVGQKSLRDRWQSTSKTSRGAIALALLWSLGSTVYVVFFGEASPYVRETGLEGAVKLALVPPIFGLFAWWLLRKATR